MKQSNKKTVILFFLVQIVLIILCVGVIAVAVTSCSSDRAGSAPAPSATPCQHYWIDGVCQFCGSVCAHPHFDDGVCRVCSYVCPHLMWENGYCVVCGTKCSHPSHNADTAVCDICGLQLYHTYTANKCSCGKKLSFASSTVPAGLLSECPQQGTVETVSYFVPDYYEHPDVLTDKDMMIYLPYGYSEEKQYDVLVMIHGGGGACEDWMTQEWEINGEYVKLVNLYDNMIMQRLCKPMIIVSVTSLVFDGEWFQDCEFPQFARELREEVLPYIAENYSTYAAGSSDEDLIAARDHFGIGGNSNGCLYAMNSGLERDLAVFSNFICMSGSADATEASSLINISGMKDYSINCFFMAAGAYDGQLNNTQYGYNTIVKNTARLTTNTNAWLTTISNAGHDWQTWTTGMYNALLVTFPGLEA